MTVKGVFTCPIRKCLSSRIQSDLALEEAENGRRSEAQARALEISALKKENLASRGQCETLEEDLKALEVQRAGLQVKAQSLAAELEAAAAERQALETALSDLKQKYQASGEEVGGERLDICMVGLGRLVDLSRTQPLAMMTV